jgi:hypothetical protein
MGATGAGDFNRFTGRIKLKFDYNVVARENSN